MGALLVGHINFCYQTWQGQSVMFSLKLLFIKKTLRPLFKDELQLAQGYRGTTRRQFTFYFWSSGLPGTYLVNFGRMKGCADLGATKRF